MEQLLLFVWKIQSWLLGTAEIHTTEQRILEECANKSPQAPEPWAEGLYRPASRLYEKGWVPRRGLDEFIIHGALLECFLDFLEARSKGMSAAALGGEYLSVFERFFHHPDASFRLLSNFCYLAVFSNGVLQGRGVRITHIEGDPPIQSFLKSQIAEHGVEQTTVDLLEIWNESGAWIFWWLAYQLLEAAGEGSCVATDFLTAVLNQSRVEKGQSCFAAARVCTLYPYMMKGASEKSMRNMLVAKTVLVDKLKQELPHIATYHVIARWLQVLSSGLREALVIELLFQGTSQPAWQIDSRVEKLIEEFLGPETWQALCVLQDERFWKKSGKGDGGIRSFRADPDRSTSEYQFFLKQLQQAPFSKHDWQLAECVDRSIAKARVTEKEAREAWETAVDLLAGDIVLSVTHLTDQGLSLPRHSDEFLGDTFKVVTVATHPILGQNGAACRFSIELAELPKVSIPLRPRTWQDDPGLKRAGGRR
ncbi:MAG: hypothetical protein HYZ51_01985 [Candidatus Doudnabacteria bacterium]|nr:hypothetical protein [Candidatus Doudnabacteria bacterium]